MALNRFNQQHARILRRRKLRNLARPIVTLATAGLFGLWIVGFLTTLEPTGATARAAHGWNGLHEDAHRARLETAAEVHTLRTGAPPTSTHELLQAGLLRETSLHWPSHTLPWRLDSTRTPAPFVPPLR